MKYKTYEKLFKIKNIFHKLPKHIYCHRCLREIDKTKETFYVNYDIKNKEYSYMCDQCNKFFENQMKERDRKFREKCPLHKDCSLWCETCAKKCEEIEDE